MFSMPASISRSSFSNPRWISSAADAWKWEGILVMLFENVHLFSSLLMWTSWNFLRAPRWSIPVAFAASFHSQFVVCLLIKNDTFHQFIVFRNRWESIWWLTNIILNLLNRFMQHLDLIAQFIYVIEQSEILLFLFGKESGQFVQIFFAGQLLTYIWKQRHRNDQ